MTATHNITCTQKPISRRFNLYRFTLYVDSLPIYAIEIVARTPKIASAYAIPELMIWVD